MRDERLTNICLQFTIRVVPASFRLAIAFRRLTPVNSTWLKSAATPPRLVRLVSIWEHCSVMIAQRIWRKTIRAALRCIAVTVRPMHTHASYRWAMVSWSYLVSDLFLGGNLCVFTWASSFFFGIFVLRVFYRLIWSGCQCQCKWPAWNDLYELMGTQTLTPSRRSSTREYFYTRTIPNTLPDVEQRPNYWGLQPFGRVCPTVSIHNNKFSFARKGQVEDLKCRTTVCWLPDPAVGASSDPHDPLGSEERLAAPP